MTTTDQITTKEELAEYILQLVSDALNNDSSLEALKAIFDAAFHHPAFKSQDMVFYYKELKGNPIESFADITSIFIDTYIHSDKAELLGYAVLMWTEPYDFINSKYFTLEHFNTCYYDPGIPNNIKEHMLRKLPYL